MRTQCDMRRRGGSGNSDEFEAELTFRWSEMWQQEEAREGPGTILLQRKTPGCCRACTGDRCSTWRRPVVVKSDCTHTQNLPPCNGRQALPYRPGAHCQPGNRGLQVRTCMARYSAQRGSARFPVAGDRRVRMKADGLPGDLWAPRGRPPTPRAAHVRASRSIGSDASGMRVRKRCRFTAGAV